MNAVTQLRKQGKLNEAWKQANEYLKLNPMDQKLKEQMLWVYYAFLKQEFEKNGNANMIKIFGQLMVLGVFDNDYFNNGLNWMLTKYLIGLKVSRNKPDLNLITAFIKILVKQKPSESKSIFIQNLLSIIKTYPLLEHLVLELNNVDFRAEDEHPRALNGKQLMPIIERWVYAFMKVVLKGQNDQSKVIDNQKVTAILEKFPHYQFLNYYYAHFLLKNDQMDLAKKKAYIFLLQHLKKSWAWELYADCLDDKKLKTDCLANAVCLCSKEEYGLTALNKLFSLLKANKSPDLQNKIASHIARIRQRNQWNVSDEIIQIAANNNKLISDTQYREFIMQASEHALNELLNELEQKTALKTGYDSKRNLSFFICQDGEKNRYKLNKQDAKKDLFHLYFYQGKVVHMRAIDKHISVDYDYIKTIKAKIIHKDKFGFIADAYIANRIYISIKDREEAQVICVKEKHPKLSKMVWKVISLWE